MSEMMTIEWTDFERVEMRVGTILTAELNQTAKKPAYILTIDFGERGIKTSSAQLTANYTAADLIGRQVVGVLNFPIKRIAGVKSEVLVLGALDPERGVVLLQPTMSVVNGSPIG